MQDTALDLLVIGGGVTGAGAALDAASRGLRVGLVEQRDYGSGTSSRSSKMFHGGLRYLEQFNFGLVKEALAERNLMVSKLCPHLVRPTPFVYPLRYPIWERFYVGAGVMLYELLARMANNPLPWHRHLGRKGLAQVAPDLVARGGVQYWDTVVDDARHTMTLARTARSNGALMAPSTRVVGHKRQEDVSIVTLLDLESGKHLNVAARTVINATGVWTDDIEEMGGETGIDVRASKGIHLVIPRSAVDLDSGVILRTKVSVLFIIPWRDHWIVGTTDTPWNLRRAHPAASRTDIDYLLTWASTALRTPIKAEDIVGVYAGLRPLLTGETDQTSKLSREHAVVDRGGGLITVAGGKYTTYRVMAQDAVDQAMPYLDRTAESKTDEIPLVGATSLSDDRMISRYGSMVDDVGDPTPLVDDAPYTRGEIAYAVTHEGALHLDDVLARRTRISIETRHRGLSAATPAAQIMATHLGWDQATVEREIEHYEARVAAELDSQTQDDDATADAARMGAPDVRTGVSE